MEQWETLQVWEVIEILKECDEEAEVYINAGEGLVPVGEIEVRTVFNIQEVTLCSNE